MTAIPAGIDEVTPQWLTSAFDDATVTDARAERIAADVGYPVSEGLTTETRRGHDELLLREYLEHLARHHRDDYTFDERAALPLRVVYLMLLPVIILVGWDALPARPRDLCLTPVDRAVATIDDIGALEVFG